MEKTENSTMSFDERLDKTNGESVSSSTPSDVKSTAVVKYESFPLLSPFNRLQSNTNLNIPPSNWLRSNSRPEKYVRDIPWMSDRREQSEFTSFNMANHFLDDITENVDVVSDASNIKKLLKMPFSETSHISMMVHRIGQTLLLDEFDIHKHLLRKEKEEWKWLRTFYEQIVATKSTEGKLKYVPKKSKSRITLQNRNMYSKFLYHSVQPDGDCEVDDKNGTSSVIRCHGDEEPQSVDNDEDKIIPLPDPVPELEDSSGFPREVLWTFENIRMLIGADLPIFGDEAHPCVSLRLRESAEKINVLTGLDYWLDNLMCNVPEVAMCFHLDGFVQKYELLKTEDIPHYENSQFDPQLVLDIARNILSFLKSNATLEGHTYWLYKDCNDDVVKLYDLTTLCEGEVNNGNPFTVPVGILLYRVARNLRKNSGRKKTATVRKLLENCLLLLDEEKHSQVCTSAYYLLSDLYVPDSSIKDVWQSNSDDSDDDSRSIDEDEIEEKDGRDEVSVNIKTLCQVRPGYDQGWHAVRAHPIAGTVEERCQDAFKCIRKGLDCVCRAVKVKPKNISIVEKQASCNKSEAIPLGYTCISSPSTDNDLQLYTMVNPSWQCLSKSLLLRKAAMTFYCAGKEYLSIQKYGHALRQIRFAMVCFEEMRTLIPKKGEENNNLLTLMLEMAGDIRVIMARNAKTLDEQEKYFTDISEEEAAIVDRTIRSSRTPEYQWVYEWSNGLEQNLDISVRCYQQALTLKPTDKTRDTNLRKRLGNSLNELGVWHMNSAQSTLQASGIKKVNLDKLKAMWKKSENCFIQGKEIFQSIHDKANTTLLLSNTGRLMRLCAQTYTQFTISSDCPEFTMTEREYYTKAIDCYKLALTVLKNKKQYSEIYESVMWELSTTYYNMAMLLQDYAPLSTHDKEEIEKDVIDLMNKSLKCCSVDCASARLPMCQYRSATIHHRLASLYHNTLRDKLSDQKRRFVKQLSESHYVKAINMFKQLECPVEMLRSCLEKVALMEFCQSAQSSSNNKGKIKALAAVLLALTDCEEGLDSLIDQPETGTHDDKDSLIDILKSRIQYLLLHLVKSYTALSKGKHERIVQEVKSLYARSLQVQTDKESDDLVQLKKVLQDCKILVEAIHQDIG